MKLYFASSNEHKKKEMSRLLGGYSLTLPKEEGIAFDPVENGKSFIENALIKAETLYSIVKKPVLADDSGLSVDALNGEPGIFTARYGEKEKGRKLTDREKYLFLLENMEGVENRNARFICALCLYLSPTQIYIIQEDAKGKIALSPEDGPGGFGYDPIFYNNEAGKIVATLTEGEKDNYSHRGKASRLIKIILDEVEKDERKKGSEN